MTDALRIGLVICLTLAMGTALAFNGHIVTEGPLELSIAPIADVEDLDRVAGVPPAIRGRDALDTTRPGWPRHVKVTVANKGNSSLAVHLRLAGLVDEWYAVGQTQKRLAIGSGEQAGAVFRIAAGEGVCSALYPVHIYADFEHQGQTLTAHAVQIFASRFARSIAASADPPQLPVNAAPANGALPLWRLRTHRAAWCYYDKPLVYMPAGWQGSSAESSANLSYSRISRGATKNAIVMHPPWKPGGGTIFAEFLLELPAVTPIKLLFANAIRDHTAAEPASDGVTFRVWAGDERLFERHTDSKKWLDAEVDLSEFAGGTILLRLESHPGPKHNTVCDSSYWGEPMIIAGKPPEPMPEVEKEELRASARSLVKAGSGRGFILTLDEQYRAAVILGRRGFADMVIAIGNKDTCVVFD
ncbi:MAG: COG1470 family protein, partial [Planctomycetota bacterium]